MKVRFNKVGVKVLIIVIILLTLFCSYLLLVNNPKFKIKASIKYIFKNVNSVMDNAQNSSILNNFLESKIEITNKIKANISLNENTINKIDLSFIDIQNIVNASNIETNIKSDFKNKYTDIKLDYSYDNEKLSGNAYIDDNEMYLLIKDYFDKYIKIDVDKFNEKTITNIKSDEIRYLLDILKISIVDSVSYSEVSSSKEIINIEEEKLSVNKTTLNIDTNFINKVTTILYNKILLDEKAKKILINFVDSDRYSTITNLEDYIKDELNKIQNSNYSNEVFAEYSLYTSGMFSNLVRTEIKSTKYDSALQYTVYDTVKFDTQISVYEKNELVSQVNLKETSANNYDISITYGKDISMDIKGVINQFNIDINYTLRISGMNDFRGNLSLETVTIDTNQTSQTLNLKLDSPESYGTANLTIDTTIKKIDNITKPDFAENIKSGSLTTGQLMDMYINFQSKNPLITNKINEIISLLI